MIGRSEAQTIARNLCESRGWPVRPPVTIHAERNWIVIPSVWIVETNGGKIGGNACIEIDAKTGIVLSAQYWER